MKVTPRRLIFLVVVITVQLFLLPVFQASAVIVEAEEAKQQPVDSSYSEEGVCPVPDEVSQQKAEDNNSSEDDDDDDQSELERRQRYNISKPVLPIFMVPSFAGTRLRSWSRLDCSSMSATYHVGGAVWLDFKRMVCKCIGK